MALKVYTLVTNGCSVYVLIQFELYIVHALASPNEWTNEEVDFFFFGLNMFLVPIKLQPSKFSPYLILIAFLIPTKKNLLIILVPAKINFV
jgi:hypothetical protein